MEIEKKKMESEQMKTLRQDFEKKIEEHFENGLHKLETIGVHVNNVVAKDLKGDVLKSCQDAYERFIKEKAGFSPSSNIVNSTAIP